MRTISIILRIYIATLHSSYKLAMKSYNQYDYSSEFNIPHYIAERSRYSTVPEEVLTVPSSNSAEAIVSLNVLELSEFSSFASFFSLKLKLRILSVYLATTLYLQCLVLLMSELYMSGIKVLLHLMYISSFPLS